jgi:DNA-binding MarR family transcriptional regulator
MQSLIVATRTDNRLKQPGLNLVEKKMDPMQGSRTRSLHLTRQGRAFVERMLAPLNWLAG